MNDAPKTLPDIVKVAAALLIAHGVLLVLNAARSSQQTGDWSGLLYLLIWLGVTIVLAGALCERQVWAWWVATNCGAAIGIFNLLQVVGYFMFQSSGIAEVNLTFSPALIGAAGIVLLLSTALLMAPEAKAAFGQRKGQSQPPNPPRDPGGYDKQIDEPQNDDTD